MAHSNYSSVVENLDSSEFPETLSIVPLRNAVLLPGGMLSITVGRPKTLALLRDLDPASEAVGIVTQKKAEVEDPSASDMHEIGTIARIVKVQRIKEDTYLMVVNGIVRFKLDEMLQDAPYWKAKISPVEEKDRTSVEAKALTQSLKEMARQMIELLTDAPGGVVDLLDDIEDPGMLADLVGSQLKLSSDQRLELLTTLDVPLRLRHTLAHLAQLRETLEVRQKINAQVRSEFNRHQREAILRQQLKAIQEELGEREPADELDELRQRVYDANLPEDALKAAEKELDRLQRMNPQQADYHVSRTYIECLIELPWSKTTDDRIDLVEVEKTLDEGHFGMEKVKRRILEYLAIRRLNPEKKGPILCLVGPPGVGKTSLGTAIASAIGRKFVRASLGGVRDEAEIRGHRRTYVGAMPGRIIAGLRKGGTKNPVFLLDEIDKMGMSMHGDPASALLEVLDPEQNSTFSDHYVEVPFDLSKVMFIATANQLDPIPPALRDRMEIIEVPSYSPLDKLVIARRYLIPRQIEDNGLKPDQFTLPDDMVARLIESYTREAGVRQLERHLAALCRAAALEIGGGKAESFTVDEAVMTKVLGSPRYFPEVAERTSRPGVATGLAWTATGGDLLFIESTRMPGKGQLNLTGQLGDVMKESAQAALSYVRSNARSLGISPHFLEKEDIHIHFPAGAIPKDGPSAGVTIFTALTSLLTDRKVSKDVAMTGEVTLRGQVLPVGGIKEKVLAAQRGGVKRVILPARNKHDVDDLPQETRDALEFIFVHEMDEVLEAALEESPIIERDEDVLNDMAAALAHSPQGIDQLPLSQMRHSPPPTR